MNRRNEQLFRRLEQLMASGVPYTDAWIEANREYMGSLADRADDLRKREREER